MLVILPVIIISTQEALRAVPSSSARGCFGIRVNPVASSQKSYFAGRDSKYHDRCDIVDESRNWRGRTYFDSVWNRFYYSGPATFDG